MTTFLATCQPDANFHKYFKQRMAMMGFDTPKGYFDTAKQAAKTAAELLAAFTLLPKTATAAELIGATVLAEQVAVAITVGAAFYLGCVIGSLMVAATKTMGCEYSITEMSIFLEMNQLKFDGWNEFFHSHPSLFRETPKHLEYAYV